MKIKELKEYIGSIATKHKDIKYFHCGTTKEIIGKSRSELEYPCLWLEIPTLGIKSNQVGFFAENVFAIIVMCNTAESEDSVVDEVWDLTQEIMLEVLAKLKTDLEKRVINGLSLEDMELEPISSLTFDNDYGWRVELRVAKNTTLKLNPDKWDL